MPTPEEIEASGFAAEDFVSDPVDVLPGNEPVYGLFAKLDTQWRVGMNGPTGLDYNVAYHMMDRMRLTPDEYADMESDLRTMEVAALKEMRKK
jgi:hypothetical protein